MSALRLARILADTLCRLSSICLSRFMLNLRAIALSGRPRGSMGTNLTLSGVRPVSCAVVGNLGTSLLSLSRQPVPNDDENDDDRGSVNSERDEDSVEFRHVSDDPLMTGIVDDID